MSGIDLQGETEQSLVEALQQGKQEMLSVLYDAYAPVMMGVIARIVPDKEQAEEVLQETFVAIWSRIDVYDSSKGRFLIWGLAIARGIALEAVKNGQYIPGNSASAAPQQAREPKPKPFCDLEPQERAILELIYLKGYSCSEVTAELNITEETLRTILKKAFIHLKAEKSA
ncbi:RNA polymerase sigma factor [Pontibacter akesuensis]|uniref:RNA polymerase sigma-70 factor, ECF subfamily n=1 Tax=Pontibacter akesuensis TaxID=388950 RepID=A0A1I7KSZ2_9BACT|nr:sigma-70 family RNA polymerase sigma factor [Pontibacter akesuensis]GHA80832.1 DNA-directed RNA polymerase sigma-70 factor [Pontibacter akesuensis]SFV00540.1 RNA polymerase sigma-70 factor, ECF subfamily [Pontibacter akesuensis]